MQQKNPFEAIKTYDSYRHVWQLTAFVLFTQVLTYLVTSLAAHLFGAELGDYEASIPAFLLTAYISWTVLSGLGVAWRPAWADWRLNAGRDMVKALRYLAGYAGVLLVMAAALGTAYYLFGDSFSEVMRPVSDVSTAQELSVKTQASSAPRLLLLFFSTCLLAPVVEEVLFRRIIFTTLRLKRGFWFSAFWSGLIFAFFHGGAAFVTLPVGLYLAWVYERERRLPVNIMLHGMVNFLVIIYKNFS